MTHDNSTNILTDPKIDTIKQMYEAFGRSDVEAVLAPLADDIDWVAVPGSNAAPWFGTYRGKAEVPLFFQAIGASVEVTEFEPLSFTANDREVIVAIQWGYRVPATGRTASMIMYHWWRFEGDRIVSVRTAEDTGQAANAFEL